MSAREQRIAEARRAVHESLTLHSAPEADRIRGLIQELENALLAPADTCEIPHETVEEEDECEKNRFSSILSEGSVEPEELNERFSAEFIKHINKGREG